ncbi:hypothetical protein HMPREF9151_01436 [Hoylesella saccharolytica F0055]|uniref:Uncharacterized protein n=1 Tax=Hoylesella saccharolytica F0055 TaxID=1127699 RepID=L1N9M4_9BACT|nr:hypothetical protein HMPREF9151_01436 [Hoylesella saccharolytica F0055]
MVFTSNLPPIHPIRCGATFFIECCATSFFVPKPLRFNHNRCSSNH